MSVRPPDVKDNWEDCNVYIQADIMAYEQIRSIEESKIIEMTMNIPRLF